MANTPVSARPSYSKPLTPGEVEGSERELFDLLKKALEPSFVLVRRIGAGGMGIVFLARDPALKRLVAVKVMSPERAVDDEARARFQREAEAVAKIAHPNVVAIHSVGQLENGIPYLVMQYVEGRSMSERLKAEGPLELQEAKSIIGQVAAALGAAHRRGVIHRDIKAANILWDDASGRALVSDFGIAALVDRESDGDPMQLTQTGVVVGTPQYMSPEQLLAERVSEKTDVYSLGLLSYELLAREGPFPQMTSPNQMIVAHLRDVPRPISSLRADVDPSFEALLNSCLEKDPHARPDAEEVARRLQHSTSVVLEWPPPGLEDLQGIAPEPARRMLFGGLAVAGPLTVLATAVAGTPLYLEWPEAAALPGLAIIGGLAWLSAAASLARSVPLIARAAKAGYGWQVLAAVLVDSRKDMGAVISGDREYGALSSSQREWIRRARVARVGITLGGASWAIAGVLIALPIGARLAGSATVFALTLLGPPIAAVFASMWLEAREHSMLKPIRKRMRLHTARLDRLSSLASTWTNAFERVASRAFLARDRFRRRALIAIGAVGLAVAGALTVIGMTAVSTVGKVALATGFTRMTGTGVRVRNAARLEHLRPVVDRSITPLAAGEALNDIQAAGYSTSSSASTLAPKEALPRIEDVGNGNKEFGRYWQEGNAMRIAARGLTREQRAFLEQASVRPGQRQYAVLAHAADIDWFSAAIPQPLPANMTILAVPIPRFSPLRALTSAQFAKAVLARADGRIPEAERLLQEVVGVGFNLMQGRTLIENLIGANMVLRARDELVALYETTGRAAEARPILKSADLGRNFDPNDPGDRPLTAFEQDQAITRIIGDPREPPGLRWEMAGRFAAFKPCTQLREIVFGPDPEHYDRLAAARKALVRNAGDDAIMKVIERSLEVPVTIEAKSIATRSLLGFARVVDAMTGSKRMTTCATLMSPDR